MLHLCIRCIYIYKADHPGCKFIGLRFLSCFFLSKKKASTEEANIFVWALQHSTRSELALTAQLLLATTVGAFLFFVRYRAPPKPKLHRNRNGILKFKFENR
jgi:hypothetical protein